MEIGSRHTVRILNDGELKELNHTATNRNTFAKGAIKGAKWIVEQKNGLYQYKRLFGTLKCVQ